MRFRVGVIGATGYIATSYRREIRDALGEAEIVALCARRSERLLRAAEEDQAAFVTHDWRQLVSRADVDLVLVATPDALHYEAVMECARQGKHVVCEKPVATNARHAHDMWLAYRDSRLGHFVPFWTRYVDVFRQARELVVDGELGEIKVVVYRWHNPRPAGMPFTWRDDQTLSAAGSIADVGSHAYDTVRWLLGCEAKRVLTHAKALAGDKPDLGSLDLAEALQLGKTLAASAGTEMRRATTCDYATIAWEFQNGAVGVLVLSHAPFVRKGLAPELELHGSKASLGVDRIAGSITLAQADEPPRVVQSGLSAALGNRFSRFVFPAIRQRSAGTSCEHASLEDGWRVQLFAEAAAWSARRGAWVELAEVEGAPP